ncbi:MAG: hypothetical protein ACKO0Z_25955 [Betaproteobacteria bacterium]
MFNHRTISPMSPRAEAVLSAIQAIEQELAGSPISAADLKQAGVSFENFRTTFSQPLAADSLASRVDAIANNITSTVGAGYSAENHAGKNSSAMASLMPAADYIPGRQMLREAIAMTAEGYSALRARRERRNGESVAMSLNALRAEGCNLPQDAYSAFERRYYYPIGGDVTNPDRSYTKEAYAEANNMEFAAVTVAYNMANVKQTPFIKALYNTIVQPIEQTGVVIDMPIDFIRQPVRSHAANGTATSWNRYKIPDVYVRPNDLLKLNDTKLIPVFRDSVNPELDTKKNFVVDETNGPGLKFFVEQNGVPVPTGYLSVNRQGLPVEIDYLGLCQTDEQLSRNFFDDTDQIHPNVKLVTLVYKLTGTIAGAPVTEYIIKDVTDFSTTVFQPQYQNGNTQEINLDFHVDEIYMKAGDQTSEKTNSKILAQLGTNVAALGTSLAMRIKLDEGKLYGINHNPQTLHLARVLDNSTPAVVLDPSSAGYKSVADVLATPAAGANPTITLVGFEINPVRTNYNNRSIGSVLDRQVIRETLIGRVHPSISARFPIANSSAGVDDVQVSAQNLASLLSLTEAYMEMCAVDALFARLDAVKELQNRREHRVNSRGRFTIGAELIDPVAIEMGTRSLQQMVQSLDSSNILTDARAAFNNMIRSIVVQMWVKSRFYIVNKLYNGEKAPVNVKVLCHANTAAWIGDVGDLRTLTLNDTDFNVEVVYTSNEKMCDLAGDTFNHIFVTMSGGTDNGTFNPTANGHILQSAEIVARYTRSDNGQISQEMRVQPVFSLSENNPLIGHVSIPGFNSFFAQRNLIGVGTMVVTG